MQLKLSAPTRFRPGWLFSARQDELRRCRGSEFAALTLLGVPGHVAALRRWGLSNLPHDQYEATTRHEYARLNVGLSVDAGLLAARRRQPRRAGFENPVQRRRAGGAHCLRHDVAGILESPGQRLELRRGELEDRNRDMNMALPDSAASCCSMLALFDRACEAAFRLRWPVSHWLRGASRRGAGSPSWTHST